MASLRVWHSYLSVFVAPTVIFFALTGALQIFNLHEAHGDYRPPVLIEKLSRVHKDQVFELEEDHGPEAPPVAAAAAPPPPGGPPPHHEDEDRLPLPTLLLKWFFLGAALVLATSTILGVWIALTHVTRKRLSCLLFIAGALIPLALLLV